MKKILSAVALILWSGYALAGDYTVTQLGLLIGGTYTNVAAINNAGVVVGMGDYLNPNIVGPNAAAAEWNGTTPTVLALAMTANVGANGINNAGVVVGNSSTSNGTHPVAFVTGGYLFGDFGVAYGINASEQIVGDFVCPQTCPGVAVLWLGPNTNPITLPTLGVQTWPPGSPGPASGAVGINKAGEIVGSSCFIDGTCHATLWTGDNGAFVTDLGTLGGLSSTASAINASGHIVGWANTASGAQHAAFWNRRKVIDLGTLGGNTSSANAINAAGYIVGSASTANGGGLAALWRDARSNPIDLNTEIDSSLGITLTNAVGINDKCQIAVNGIDNKTGASESFVLSLKHESKCHRCEESDDWRAQSEQHDDSRDNDCEHKRGGGDD